MNISDIVFDTYVICPLCKRKMRTLSGSHLMHKHGFSSMVEFKIEYGIPMSTALIARDIKETMHKHGKRRAKWFKENVMPKGIEQSKTTIGDMVPKEIRMHSGRLRRGQSWIPEYISEMKQQGWLDLRDAAKSLNIAYNYARKCATDGRLKVIHSKGLRFTKPEWVEDTRKLLQENRKKWRRGL